LSEEQAELIKTFVILHIPTQIGHPFRSKTATNSDPNRPGIPKQTGHP